MSHQYGLNHNDDAVAGPSNVDLLPPPSNVTSPPKIFKLNIDCLNEVFDYLDVRDLHVFAKTCKQMKKAAGEYYKENYSTAKNIWDSLVYTNYFNQDGISHFSETGSFDQYIQCITFSTQNPRNFRRISDFSKFKSLNNIALYNHCDIYSTIMDFIPLLPQLKTIQINRCQVDNSDFSEILIKCTSLKKISIRSCSISNTEWLLNAYCNLEHLEILHSFENQVEDLSKFFIRNPNIKIISIDFPILTSNKSSFLSSEVKLNTFKITGDLCMLKDNWIYFLNLLNQLYEGGFYKQLHLYINKVDEIFSNSLSSLNGFELLYVSKFEKCFKLDKLINLRELAMGSLQNTNVNDMETLANGLIKLERLYIKKFQSVNMIIPFIQKSQKLNKIKLITNQNEVDGTLNLPMLNEERSKLYGARKIIIYASDDIFLHTKWTTKNGDTNLKFIEIRRADSYDWNHEYF